MNPQIQTLARLKVKWQFFCGQKVLPAKLNQTVDRRKLNNRKSARSIAEGKEEKFFPCKVCTLYGHFFMLCGQCSLNIVQQMFVSVFAGACLCISFKKCQIIQFRTCTYRKISIGANIDSIRSE